jgi:hypothetical protein
MMGQSLHHPLKQLQMLRNHFFRNMLLQFQCLEISQTGYNVFHFDNYLIHLSIFLGRLSLQSPVFGPFLSTYIIGLHRHRTIQLAM